MDIQYINDYLDRILKNHKRNERLLIDIKQIIDINPNPETIGPLIRQYINEISKEALISRNLPSDLGFSRDICRLSDNDYEIDMQVKSTGYLFILPDLLPKRDSNGMAELNFVKYNYAAAFEKLDKIHSFQKFNKRVQLIVTNYFENETVMIDNDNVNVKPIIDTISSYFFIDDNPMWCDLAIQGRMGKTNHTEIEIYVG